MGIFQKLFGSAEEDKWALYMRLGFILAASDGNATQDEGDFSGKFIIDKGKLTQSQYDRVREKFLKMDNPFEKILELSNDEKQELLKFLLTLAMTDNEFHEKEFLFIINCTLTMGMNPQVITDYIIGLNITDVEKCKKAYDEVVRRASEDGVQMPALSFDAKKH